jgi:hypothetical protein
MATTREVIRLVTAIRLNKLEKTMWAPVGAQRISRAIFERAHFVVF